jgi:hypothetical protein
MKTVRARRVPRLFKSTILPHNPAMFEEDFMRFVVAAVLALVVSMAPLARAQNGASSLDSQLFETWLSADQYQALLDKGANVEVRDNSSFVTNGLTPLIESAMSGKQGIVRLLLNHGANTEARDKDGKTALLWADDPETVRLLLDKGANIEARNKDGYTPLIEAASGDKAGIIGLLLDRGAKIEGTKTAQRLFPGRSITDPPRRSNCCWTMAQTSTPAKTPAGQS